MTEEKRAKFLLRFSEHYDLPGAAESAGITRREAYELLRRHDARDTVDTLVSRRRSGEMLGRIAREYERMAFGDDGEIRPGDRLRAMEQLRLMASGDAGGTSPSLSIVCEYV